MAVHCGAGPGPPCSLQPPVSRLRADVHACSAEPCPHRGHGPWRLCPSHVEDNVDGECPAPCGLVIPTLSHRRAGRGGSSEQPVGGRGLRPADGWEAPSQGGTTRGQEERQGQAGLPLPCILGPVRCTAFQCPAPCAQAWQVGAGCSLETPTGPRIQTLTGRQGGAAS